MAKTRSARKQPPHQQTDGLHRNAGTRPGIQAISDAEVDEKIRRIEISGYSHPFDVPGVDIQLPDSDVVYTFATARDGLILELACFCEQIIDGPAYMRVYDQDGPVLDKDGVEVAFDLVSDDVALANEFVTVQGQRLRFVVDNVKTFPGSARPDDIPALTGSDTLSIVGVWLTGVQLARGGDRARSPQPARSPSPGS